MKKECIKSMPLYSWWKFWVECIREFMVYSIPMTTATLLKKAAAKDKGVVVLPVQEYQRLIAAAVPTYYLTGKEATDLDKLVKEGLHEHAEGKTRTIRSLADLD